MPRPCFNPACIASSPRQRLCKACHPFLSRLPTLLLPLVSAERPTGIDSVVCIAIVKERKKEARSACPNRNHTRRHHHHCHHPPDSRLAEHRATSCLSPPDSIEDDHNDWILQYPSTALTRSIGLSWICLPFFRSSLRQSSDVTHLVDPLVQDKREDTYITTLSAHRTWNSHLLLQPCILLPCLRGPVVAM